MDGIKTIDGVCFARMIHLGAANLQKQAKTINDLNVFPIPDGDTGDNMMLTILGGAEAAGEGSASLAETAKKAGDGMLFAARGNSGVILSQFFDGIARGFAGMKCADSSQLTYAFQSGVRQAYQAVAEPAEGTILTVARCGAKASAEKGSATVDETMRDFIREAKITLEKTPDMLPVLKKAGVVDSGGAGLICIMEGMLAALSSDAGVVPTVDYKTANDDIDYDRFTENSVLEYGYCTELLIRLQSTKVDLETFDANVIKDRMQELGDSVVLFRTGSAVKLHVHTFTPDRVLNFCQQFGEFLKVKIENMSLQHNNSVFDKSGDIQEERKEYAVVAVCTGEGVKEFFKTRGADAIVEGGQSMNPSTEDFIKAFDSVNADTIFVLPNNGNIILTAKQAAEMYKKSDVRVIGSRSIGDGYAALSMLDFDSGDTDEICSALNDAMEGVSTVQVSKSIRDTDEVKKGDYISFAGKQILCSEASRSECVRKTLAKSDLSQFDICIVIYGKEVPQEEAENTEKYICSHYKGKEVYLIDGKQDVYDYIFIME